MKRIVYAMIFTVFMVMPVTAGGPDISKRPEVVKHKTSQKAHVVEPIAETETGRIFEERLEAPVQPSAGVAPVTNQVVEVAGMRAKKVINVLFESVPPNAELLINGLYVGTTPVQISLNDGVHFVRMLLPKHKMWERQVQAYQGLRVFSQLEPIAEVTTPAQ